MGSDLLANDVDQLVIISIHAPAWGATVRSLRRSARAWYFNPRSRMGSDRFWMSSILIGSVFQSTLPHGERQNRVKRLDASKRFQSTLPHGERPHSPTQTCARTNFNPRSRMGSDYSATGNWTLVMKFQSTLPHGERPAARREMVEFWETDFNPRSRMGSDTEATGAASSCSYFNPRSRMGSDPSSTATSPQYDTFQSTLPHGERLILSYASCDSYGFQSTLPHGERPVGGLATMAEACDFNPRSRMGSDDSLVRIVACGQRISIHAPAWGATVRAFAKTGVV